MRIPLNQLVKSPLWSPAALLSLTFGAGLMLSGCGRAPKSDALPPNAVAVVGNQVITLEAFQEELARRARLAPGRYADPKEREALLEEMIQSEVLYQKAIAAGYDKDAQIAADLKRMITTKYQEDQLAKLGQPKVSAQEVAAFYESHPERFGTPAKVHVALIKLKVARTATVEKRAEVARRAEALLAEAKAAKVPDGTFGLLAQNHSEDQASRYRGGDIGWLTAGETNTGWPPPVLTAISNLKEPGDLAPVVETPTAFFLIKFIERHPATMRPLPDVKTGIEYLLARDKERQQQQALYAELKQELKVKSNEALLNSIKVPTQGSEPPGLPGTPARISTAQ